VLLGVDAEEHDDITFDVTNVRRSTGKISYDRRNVYSAAISSVRSVRPLDR